MFLVNLGFILNTWMNETALAHETMDSGEPFNQMSRATTLWYASMGHKGKIDKQIYRMK